MNKCKLSIIIPTYNTALFLKHTINVIINQRLKDYEIIIVDDNSKDNTKEIVTSFMDKYKNIKYLKNNKNFGAGVSRNIGYEYSSGEYVTFIDSEDWADLATYKTAVDFLDENPDCEIAIWGIKNEFTNQRSSFIRTDYKVCNIIDKELALSLLCNTYSLDITISSYLGSKIFRNSFLKMNNIYFDNILFEDVVFSFKSILYAQKVVLLPNIYTHYYQRPNSTIHSFTEKHICDMFKAFAYIRAIINNDFLLYKDNFSSLVEKCCKTLFKIMYDNIEDKEQQKKMLCCFFKHFLGFCSIENILDYLDPDRTKNLLLNF